MSDEQARNSDRRERVPAPPRAEDGAAQIADGVEIDSRLAADRSRLLVAALASAGVLSGLAAAALIVAGAEELDNAASEAATTVLSGWAFMAVGLWSRVRLPDSRIGAQLTAIGFVWMLGALNESSNPFLYVTGELIRPLFVPLTGHLLLAFPTGRLSRGPERLPVAGLYLSPRSPTRAVIPAPRIPSR
jgi:hypothetical protein